MARRTTAPLTAVALCALPLTAGCGGGDPASFEEAGGQVESGQAADLNAARRKDYVTAGLVAVGPGQSWDVVTRGNYQVSSASYRYRVECKTDDGVTWVRATVPIPGEGWGDMRVEARSDQPGWAAAELGGRRVPLSVQLPGGDGYAPEPTAAWTGASTVAIQARSEPQQEWFTTESKTPLAAYAEMRLVCQSGLG